MDQLIPKKRKRSSSSSSQNPFAGILTRSKSQIYLHCHRSGRARSDSVRRTKYLWSTPAHQISSKKCTQNSQTEEGTSHSDDWSTSTSTSFIKDLRTRRIFSLEEKKGATEDELSSYYVHSNKSDLEFPTHEHNSINLQVHHAGQILAEECLQATPPDPEILHKLSLNNIDRKHSSNSVLRSPLSRVKVFRAPYSFSYRRLLPYLTSMAQDNSCAATNHNCSNVVIEDETKVDNSMETLSAHHISDSAIRIPPQKDSSPTSFDGELCSTNFVNSLNENIQKSLDGEECAKKHQLCQDHEVRQGSCSTMQTESVGIQVFDLTCSDTTAIDANPVSSYVSTEGENNTKEEGDDNVVADKVDDSNEESIRMMLPAVDILGNAMAYQNADNRVELVSQSAGHVLGRPVNVIVPQDNSCSSVKRMNCSKRKLGLSPCSQLKLFKTRSSFSYRRLLPILMDIAKDSSGDDSGNSHCPKVEKIVEENLLSSLSVSVDETRAHKLNNNSIHLDHDNDSSTVQMAKQTSNHESGCLLSSLVASDHKTDNPDSVVKEQEQDLQVMEVISEDKRRLSTSAIENLTHETKPDSMTVCSSVVSSNSRAVVLADSVVHESSTNSEEDSRTLGTKVELNAANPVQASSFSSSKNSYKLDASYPLEIQIPVNGSTKGILKKNPRGCRGPCTCLNCSSFRLNAERAFEFSKNQMLDAEEVALELIEELSHLRNMLGTATSGCTDDLVIHINQVKEGLVRASEAEEVAKSRLTKMNYDLNIHCRRTDGQRPRVKFANNVE